MSCLRSDQAHLRLTLDVRYDLGRTDLGILKRLMMAAATRLMDEGLLTQATEAEIDKWNFNVQSIEDETAGEID